MISRLAVVIKRAYDGVLPNDVAECLARAVFDELVLERNDLIGLLERIRLALMGPIPENLDHPLLDEIETKELLYGAKPKETKP